MRKNKEPSEKKSMLKAPEILLPKTNLLSSFFYYTVVLFLAGSGAMGCFFTAFGISFDPVPVLAVGAGCAVICTAQFLLSRWKWIISLIFAAFWGILLWRCFGDVAQGCLRTINVVLAAYESKLNFSLPAFDLSWVSPAEETRLFGLFAMFLQPLFFEVLSWLLVLRQSSLGAFAWTGLFLLLPLAFSIQPSPWAVGLLLLFWAFLLMAAPSMRHEKRQGGKQKHIRTSGISFLQPVSLLLLPLVALCMIFIYKTWPPDTYKRPTFANEIRTGLTEGINLPALFRGGTGSGGNRIDLASLGDRNYTGKTVLQSRHQWGDRSSYLKKDYLKSFVGSVYTGTSWELLAPEDAEEAASCLAGQKAQTLSADLDLLLPSFYNGGPFYTLSVRKVNVDSRSVYSPGGLYAAETELTDIAYIDDAFLKSSHLFSGPKEYTLSAYALPESGVCMLNRFSTYAVLQIIQNTSAGVVADSSTEVSQGSVFSQDTLDMLYDQWDEDQAAASAPLIPDLWKLPDWAVELADDDAAQAVISRVESYSEFVYDHYTRLPDDLREFLEDYRAEHDLAAPQQADCIPNTIEFDQLELVQSQEQLFTKHQLSFRRIQDYYLECAEQIRDLLAEECTYTLTPPTLPQGRDFVEYFLSESKEGYCVHFATAAVALLRSCGIPARYAEGYVVPVDENEDWVDVPDYNAHAWVEIYWGGSGWIPFEVTPPGPDAPAAYANAIGPSTPQETQQLSESDSLNGPDRPNLAELPELVPDGQADTLSPSPTPSSAAAATRKEEKETGWSAFLTFLLVLGILALPFLLIWIARLVRLAWRKHTFRQKDRNKAALRVYVHLRRLYKENYVLPYGGVDLPEEVEQLALKARFSNHVLTPEELSTLTDLASKLEKRLDENLYGYYHVRCKYLLALF